MRFCRSEATAGKSLRETMSQKLLLQGKSCRARRRHGGGCFFSGWLHQDASYDFCSMCGPEFWPTVPEREMEPPPAARPVEWQCSYLLYSRRVRRPVANGIEKRSNHDSSHLVCRDNTRSGCVPPRLPAAADDATLPQTTLAQALEVRRGTFGAGYLTLREDQWMAAIFHPAAVRSSTINSTPWLWIGRSR
jgi:hypothetical protein